MAALSAPRGDGCEEHAGRLCLTTSKILTRNGVQTKHPGLSAEDIGQAAQLYGDGWSLARIGERLGVTATTVHRRLRERGVTMRTPSGAAR